MGRSPYSEGGAVVMVARRSRLGRHRRRSAVVRYQIDHQTPDGPSNLRGDVQVHPSAAIAASVAMIALLESDHSNNVNDGNKLK